MCKEYGRSLSTVFGSIEKQYAIADDDDDDEDPILSELRILDYRYIRFCFHPLKDRFVLSNGWTDPMWTDVKSIRTGIDGDEKEMRELVFGKNLIDIEQKSIPQLLVDEVGTYSPSLEADTDRCRLFTLSMSSRLQVWSCGLWTNTTTTLHAFSSSRCLALPLPLLRHVP
jgi:cation-transporting ATPase 13A3/4/5